MRQQDHVQAILASWCYGLLQVDACRLGGLNEVLAVMLLAKKFGAPLYPHIGGVGLPEYSQHVSTIDYLVVSGKKNVLEYINALHEHFKHPAEIDDGHHVSPLSAGYSVEMLAASMEKFSFPGPDGGFWRSEEATPLLEADRVIC